MQMERHWLKKLCRLSKKSHQTNFFQTLVERQRLDTTQVHHNKTLQRFFFRFLHNLRRQAFSEWRNQAQT